MNSKFQPTVYDFILSFFTSDDDFRPSLQSPGIQNDKVCATDVHSGISFDKNKCAPYLLKAYEQNEKFPDYLGVVASTNKEATKQSAIDTDDLMKLFFSCQLESGYYIEVCTTCDGSGEIECPCCGNDAECNSCNGTGTEKELNPYDVGSPVGDKIVFEEIKFSPYLLYRIAHVAYILGIETIYYTVYSETQRILFELDDVSILILGHKTLKP